MLDRKSLTLATATLVPHRGPISAAEMRSLFDAAAAAGFTGIEFWAKHHDSAVEDGMSSDEFFDYPRQLGLSMIASEFSDWWASPDRKLVQEANAHLLELTSRAGAPFVNTVARELPSFDDAVAGLGHLCDLAADQGLRISLEVVPFGGVPNIHAAVRLIEATDRENLGLCLDPWHWYRQPGGPDIETLRRIPGERIFVLQLDDATQRPQEGEQLIVETMTARVLPGEGVVNILEILDVLDEIGASPPVVSEVYSKTLFSLEPGENARRQHDAAEALLAQHEASKAH